MSFGGRLLAGIPGKCRSENEGRLARSRFYEGWTVAFLERN
jgi:hypothetical protein